MILESKAFEKFINTKYEGDGSEWKAARKEYLEAFSLSEELNVKNNMNLDSATKLLEAAGDISSSLSSTTKSAATDVSASVSEAAKDVATSVSTSVAENTNEIAQDIAKEVAQEVAEEVTQEVSKDLVKEVAEEVGKTLADLKAEERAAWEEYSKDGWNMEKKQKHLDALEAVQKKERETSQ